MKTDHRITRCLALLALLTFSPQFSTALAQGTAFSYQGQLKDSGAPANGSYDLTFALFSSSNGVGQVGNTLTNLNTDVTNGLFVVTLDFGPGVFTGGSLWLQIGVRTNGGTTFTALAPLQPILPVPYAAMANTASNLLGNLSATQLSGTVPVAQLPAAVVTNGATGATLTGTFIGSGAGLTGTQAGSFDVNGSNIISAIAIAVARSNNFVAPLGDTRNLSGALFISNGVSNTGIVVGYAGTAGNTLTNSGLTGTLIQPDGGILTGGYIAINPNFIGYNQIPYMGGVGAMFGFQQDTQAGMKFFNGGSGSSMMTIYQRFIYGGTTSTNEAYPFGEEWFDMDSQGRQNFYAPAASLAVGTVQSEPYFFNFAYAQLTSLDPVIWGPTNVYQLALTTNNVLTLGSLSNASPNMISNAVNGWSGTVYPDLTVSTNSVSLGRGAITVKYTGAPQTLITNRLVVNVGTYYPSNSFNLFAITNGMSNFEHWIGSSNGVMIDLYYSNRVVYFNRLP